MEVVLLNCCVTDTKDTLYWSNSSTSLAKSTRERVSRYDIILPGMCCGVNVSSPHAHARMKSVDIESEGSSGVTDGFDERRRQARSARRVYCHDPRGSRRAEGHRNYKQLLQSDKARLAGDRDAAETVVDLDQENASTMALFVIGGTLDLSRAQH
jgi:hypothetical protein